MRTALDAVRSLAYYCYEALGDAWEVRTAEEPEAFTRPFCLVGPSGPETTSGPAVHRDVVLPCAIHLWTEQGANPEDALWKALAAEERLVHMIDVGVGVGGPRRVPLWDCEHVPADQLPTLRGLSDYLRVGDFSVTRVRDPDDATLYEVVADVRLGWRRRGRVPSGTERARAVNTRPTSTN